jgi:hypothetical protein
VFEGDGGRWAVVDWVGVFVGLERVVRCCVHSLAYVPISVYSLFITCPLFFVDKVSRLCSLIVIILFVYSAENWIAKQ